jgi:hypothetical protein
MLTFDVCVCVCLFNALDVAATAGTELPRCLHLLSSFLTHSFERSTDFQSWLKKNFVQWVILSGCAWRMDKVRRLAMPLKLLPFLCNFLMQCGSLSVSSHRISNSIQDTFCALRSMYIRVALEHSSRHANLSVKSWQFGPRPYRFGAISA